MILVTLSLELTASFNCTFFLNWFPVSANLFVLVTSCLVVAVQPCMEWILNLKKKKRLSCKNIKLASEITSIYLWFKTPLQIHYHIWSTVEMWKVLGDLDHHMLKDHIFCDTKNKELLCVVNHFSCNTFFSKRMRKATFKVDFCLIRYSLYVKFTGCVTT